MDSSYLKKHVGKALALGLSEVCQKKPIDPIEFLSTWLQKHVENLADQAKEEALQEQLEREREAAEEEQRRQQAMLEEQEMIAKEMLKRDMENEQDTSEVVREDEIPPEISVKIDEGEKDGESNEMVTKNDENNEKIPTLPDKEEKHQIEAIAEESEPQISGIESQIGTENSKDSQLEDKPEEENIPTQEKLDSNADLDNQSSGRDDIPEDFSEENKIVENSERVEPQDKENGKIEDQFSDENKDQKREQIPSTENEVESLSEDNRKENELSINKESNVKEQVSAEDTGMMQDSLDVRE